MSFRIQNTRSEWIQIDLGSLGQINRSSSLWQSILVVSYFGSIGVTAAKYRNVQSIAGASFADTNWDSLLSLLDC